jgi:hypothetical protein
MPALSFQEYAALPLGEKLKELFSARTKGDRKSWSTFARKCTILCIAVLVMKATNFALSGKTLIECYDKKAKGKFKQNKITGSSIVDGLVNKAATQAVRTGYHMLFFQKVPAIIDLHLVKIATYKVGADGADLDKTCGLGIFGVWFTRDISNDEKMEFGRRLSHGYGLWTLGDMFLFFKCLQKKD